MLHRAQHEIITAAQGINKKKADYRLTTSLKTTQACLYCKQI